MKNLNHSVLYLSIIGLLVIPTYTFADQNSIHVLDTLVTKADTSDATEETKAYIVKKSKSATKLNIETKETPQTVNVVTKQQLEDFNLTSAKAALAATPGIYVSNQETDRSTFISRGFNISNMQIDGFNLPLMGSDYFIGTTDLVTYDRIEVTKGSNALTSAVGSPSATVNYIRKRPTKNFQASANVSYGSWDTQRYEADVSGSLTSDGRVRARVMGAEEKGNSYLDNYSHETNIGAALLEADLTNTTLLTVGFSQQKHKPNGNNWGSLPMLDSSGNKLSYSRSYNPMPDWVYWDSEVQNSFAELKQQLGGDWTLNASYMYNKQEDNGQMLYFTGTPTSSGSGVKNYPSKYSETVKSQVADVNVQGTFPLFDQRHELVFGYTWAKTDTNQLSYYINGTTSAISNWWNYNAQSYSEPTYSSSLSADYTQTQKSTYLATRLHLTDDLKLLLGANYTEAQAKGASYGAPVSYDKDKFIPYSGITYNINPTYTWYASYAEVFLPTNRFSQNNTVLNPTTGKTWETGIKASWFDDNLTGSFAYFNNEFNGFPIRSSQRLSNGQWAYSTQDIKSDGFELDLSGKITDEVTTSFGIVHLNKMEDTDTKAKVRTFIPMDTFSLMTTYQPKKVEKLKLGLGAQYVGKTSYTSTSELKQSGYALLNAMASYDINSHLAVQVNGNNLTNKKYLNTLENGQSFYGAPANYTVAFKFKY